MSRIDIEKLLQPVSEDLPCGEDLSDLTDYYVLEELAKGKEETQFSEAEPPEWPKVLNLAETLLTQGKELWVVFYLVRALVVLDGAKGLALGMRLLSGILETFWEELYPELDEDDDNPADLRMNVLNNFSAPAGGFLDDLKGMPLTNSRQLGKFSFRDMLLARGELSTAGEEEVPSPAIIEGAIADTDPGEMEALVNALVEAGEAVLAADAFLTGELGDEHNTANLADLSGFIGQIREQVDQTPPSAPAQTEEDTESQGGGNGAEMPASAVFARVDPVDDEEITSQRDVIRELDRITAWYAENEPSSPVPLIIHRARSLVGRSFRDIIGELADQAEEQVTGLFGEANGESRTPAPPPRGNPGPPINGKGDITALLEKLCDWYMIFEPSSPVPLFLERARKLVGRNFMDIIDDIAGGPLEQVNALMGINRDNN